MVNSTLIKILESSKKVNTTTQGRKTKTDERDRYKLYEQIKVSFNVQFSFMIKFEKCVLIPPAINHSTIKLKITKLHKILNTPPYVLICVVKFFAQKKNEIKIP